MLHDAHAAALGLNESTGPQQKALEHAGTNASQQQLFGRHGIHRASFANQGFHPRARKLSITLENVTFLFVKDRIGS